MLLNPVMTILGWSLALLSALMLLPSLYALGAQDGNTSMAFFMSALVTIFFGGGLIFASRRENNSLARRDAFLTAVLSWTIIPIFAALPLYLSDAIARPLDAYFEAISGFTTTGSSVLQNMENQPRSIFLWRALTEWFGGFALLILVSVLASAIDVPGSNPLSRAIAKSSRRRLSRRLRYAVLSILGIYSLLTGICIVLLWFSGMPAFSAICYSLSTISTGGFTLPGAENDLFSSRLTEIVLMVFMLLGAINFSLHWAFFNGNRKAYFENPEYRYLIYLFVFVTICAVVLLNAETHLPFLDTLRYAIFNSLSALTTTGYNMAPISESGEAFYPVGFMFLLFVAMCIGGSTGSTSGGVKILRLVLMLKLGLAEIKRLSFPNAIVLLKFGKENIDRENILTTWAFLSFFIFSIILVSLGLSFMGLNLQSSLMLAMSNLANAGAIISPAMLAQSGETLNFVSYASLPDAGKVLLCICMLIGRLEFFAVLALFNPSLWRR